MPVSFGNVRGLAVGAWTGSVLRAARGVDGAEARVEQYAAIRRTAVPCRAESAALMREYVVGCARPQNALEPAWPRPRKKH